MDPNLPRIATRTNSTALVKFTMEVHIVYKKTGRKGPEASIKAPVILSGALGYEAFLDAVATAAQIRKQEVDRENLQWLPKKPANGKPTAVSNPESYGLMLKEIRSKKENQRWVVIRMGRPLISDAVRFPLLSPRSYAEYVAS